MLRAAGVLPAARTRFWRAAPADWLHRGVLVALVSLQFLQRPGETTFDTKFDLTANPGQLLSRALHLWNPYQNFGELQNQAYGYLFPQGLFFWLLDVTGVPDWVAQRLWSALLLVVAYEGCRRLHRALSPGRPVLSVLAGVAFATAPRLLGLSGVLSAEVLPTAVLPWVVLPLVHGVRGRMTPRAAGLWAGVAVLFMGGVNAVENLAALPVALLVVLSGTRTPSGRRLAGWWALATTAASLWWLLPLMVLGRYSPPFLNYIETSVATTRPLGWANTVRGADHWLAYIFVGGRPWWPGAYDLAVDPFLVAVTALVAGVSLAGLFSPSMPMRGPFACSAILGMVLLTIAHASPVGSPLDDQVRVLLDGALTPLRNVHKVDPIVRLPLALGFAHAVGLAAEWLRSRRWAPARRVIGHRFAAPVAVAVVLTLLATSAAPLFTNRIRKSGWSEVPDAWHQVADHIADRGGGSTLVLPGSGFGQQWWGWTIDEPIQGVASTPWVVRSQVPLVPGATLRFLDGIEERVADGVGSSALAETVAGAGIEWLLVRRDLDLFASGAPAPARVDASLRHSPGLQLEASFGRSGFGDQAMIDLYRVTVPVANADAPLAGSLVSVAGGPGDILTARELELLADGHHAEFGPRPPDLVGDGYRRQERQFGRLHDALSQVMTAEEPFRTVRAEHDYAGLPGERLVVAAYSGLERVTASSSSGYVDALGPIQPEAGPASVVDGDPATYWQSAPFENPQGQWVELDFGREITPEGVRLRVGVDDVTGTPVRRVRVTAGEQQRVASVDPDTGFVRVALDGTPVSRVRVTVVEAEGRPDEGVVAIREVAVSGADVTRRLVVPDVEADGSTTFVFRSQAPRRGCVWTGIGPACAPEDARSRLEQLELGRVFTTHGSSVYRARGTVTGRPTPEAAVLLNPLAGVRAAASTALADDPLVSGRMAVDGDPITPWVADPSDTSPQLRLSWGVPRTLTRIQVTSAPEPYLRPVTVTVTGGGESRRVELGSAGLGFFEPLRARSVTLRFAPPSPVVERPDELLPLGVGEVRLTGIADLVLPLKWQAPTGAPCGLGPEVVVDGQAHRTEVRGTIGDLLQGTPLRWRVCDGPVLLPAGQHQLLVSSTVQYAADRLALVADSLSGSPGARSLERTSWSAAAQSYEVGAGGAAVLRIPQNFNEGWQAELHGERLEPVAVDGWQQGYELPSGDAATVQLVFAPDRWYRAALLVGVVCAMALLAAALWAGRRSRREAAKPTSAAKPLGRRARRTPPRRPWGWRVLVPAVVATLLMGLLGGPLVAVALVVTLAVSWWWPPASAWAVAVGATMVAASGIVAATSPGPEPGVPIVAADVLAALAVGILAATLGARQKGVGHGRHR